MIKIEGLSGGITQLQGVVAKTFSQANIDRALRLATSQARTDVFTRVFNEEGAKLPNGGSAGSYNVDYLRRRREEFKRTNQNINFIATGSMSRNFVIERKAYNQYILGLSEVGNRTEESNANKYTYLSERFGSFLELSDEELRNFYTVLINSLDAQQ